MRSSQPCVLVPRCLAQLYPPWGSGKLPAVWLDIVERQSVLGVCEAMGAMMLNSTLYSSVPLEWLGGTRTNVLYNAACMRYAVLDRSSVCMRECFHVVFQPVQSFVTAGPMCLHVHASAVILASLRLPKPKHGLQQCPL